MWLINSKFCERDTFIVDGNLVLEFLKSRALFGVSLSKRICLLLHLLGSFSKSVQLCFNRHNR